MYTVIFISKILYFQLTFVPLGLIFKDENINEDMLAILQMFHTYLPKSSDAAIGVDGQLFSGDQLTVERAVNVIASVANGLTPQDCLDGIHLQLGDWHASVKLLSVSVHIGVLELQSSPFKNMMEGQLL